MAAAILPPPRQGGEHVDLTCSLSSFSSGGAPCVDGSPLPSVSSAPQAAAGSRAVLGGVSPDLARFRSGVDCGLLRWCRASSASLVAPVFRLALTIGRI